MTDTSVGVLPNPDWARRTRLGLSTYNVPRELDFVDRTSSPWVAPRFLLDHPSLHGAVEAWGGRHQLTSAPDVCAPDLSILSLRGYQSDAVRAALRSWAPTGCGGVVEAPCGSGKSRIGLAISMSAGGAWAVVVHTRDLAAQWARAADDVGADIEVLTPQSAHKYDQSHLSRFCGVIVDEAHHTPARTFSHLLARCAGLWRIGLTATPRRADGLTLAMHWALGPTVWRIDSKDLTSEGHTLTFRTEVIDGGTPPPSGDAHARRAFLARSGERNAAIVRAVRSKCAEGHRALVLCDLKSHCQTLGEGLRAAGLRCEILTSDVPKGARGEILSAARRGEVDALIATSLADEGLDVPILSLLVLAGSRGAGGRYQQRVGRILRPYQGKPDPVVIRLAP